jgi:hypothetical protein
MVKLLCDEYFSFVVFFISSILNYYEQQWSWSRMLAGEGVAELEHAGHQQLQSFFLENLLVPVGITNLD